MDMQGKTVLVLGMGETGLSMARYLVRFGASVCVADSRTAPPRLREFEQAVPEAELATGVFAEAVFAGADMIAISPGVALAEPLVQQAVERGVPVMGDIELFARAISQSAGVSRPAVLAVTGSNGKTTVTSMAGAMVRRAGLDVAVAGNISPAVLDVLMQRQDAGALPQVWVLELSSFQLETMQSLQPDAAVVLNLTEDHFDRYAGMQEYAAAKSRIFAGNTGNQHRGVQVLNRDDPLVAAMALAGREQVTFGLDMPVSENDFGLLHDGSGIGLMYGRTRLLDAHELQVTGLHNMTNVLAALALCHAIDVPWDPALQAAREFTGLPHRMEKVANLAGVSFYDDSKGTNVGATVAALNGLSQHVVLIAGGDGKGQDFSPLREPVSRYARAVVLIGRDAESVAAAINGCGVPLHRVATMEEAVEKGFVLARPGDAVVMSPACASLYMFRNYVHRAEVFVAAVKAMQQKMPVTVQ